MSDGRPPRLGDRLLGFLGVRLVIWLIAAQAFVPAILFDPVDRIAYYHDEHGDIYGEEAARRSIVEFHQVPAWDPFSCGGIVGLSNPGSLVAAPDFLFRVVWGTLAGRRLAAFFFLVFGMEGTFRYARRNGAGAIGAAMAAVAFSSCGSFHHMARDGWLFMFNYNLMPWALVSFEEGLRKKWWIVAGGFFTAWLLLGAGTYQLPYTVLAFVVLVAIETGRAVLGRDGPDGVPWWRPAATFVGIGLVGAAISAFRLLPMLHFMAAHTRGVQQKDQTTPLAVLSMLAVPAEHGAWGAGAGEYYVGTAVFLLAVLALVLTERKATKFWALALFFGVFACGEFVPNAPYVFMRKIPLYGQLRFPVRMLTVCAFFIAGAASLGVTRLEDALPRLSEVLWTRARRLWSALPPAIPRAARIVVGLATTALAGALAYYAVADVVEHTHIPKGSLYVMDGPRRYKDQFRQARGNRWDAQVWPFADRGSLHCFDENQHFESPRLRGDLAAEEYPAPESGDMTVQRLSWSPHRIVLRVRAPTPGRFLVNMNHADPWQADVGTLASDGGLLSVRVPAGEHVVTLTYSDWRLRLGALVTFTTVLAIVIAGFRRLRRRGEAVARWFRMLPGVASARPAAALGAASASARDERGEPEVDKGDE